MKKLSLLLIFLTIILSAFAQTADEVVNKFVEASGGKDKWNSINTLQYKQLVRVKMPMGDVELPFQYNKEKNKLFRLDASLIFGGQSMRFYTVVSDTAAYTMIPNNPLLGTQGGLKKLTEQERAAASYQMDPAGLFAGLIDYAAKGHKVELLKDDKVNKQECYKLKFTTNVGQEVIFYINKSTNFIDRMDAKGSLAADFSGMGGMISSFGGAKSISKMEVNAIFTDYKDVDGLKFPGKMSMRLPMGDAEGSFTDIKINQPINPALYNAS